ncbi:MAG TPA: VOC family protein [Paracoccaceae bacterium]|nr:VOC family protein [Paracoccaceae bacterium]
MPEIIIDAVGVTSTDFTKTVAFYSALGFRFPDFSADDQHLEAITAPGKVRLMIDTAALAETLIGEAPRPANHSHFALLCESPAAVDAAVEAVAAAGFAVESNPWDAFWGQRYAVVKDPDGYLVDLFAPL